MMRTCVRESDDDVFWCSGGGDGEIGGEERSKVDTKRWREENN
jgi:hypothetical protein